MGHSLKDYDIHIPTELIAQYPPDERPDARLLVFDIARKKIDDTLFENIDRCIGPDDCVVYNDVRVINARLYGRKSTGARIEVLLTRKTGPREWFCLIRPGRRVKSGTFVQLKHGYGFTVKSLEGDGLFRVEFNRDTGYEDLETIGEIPLPKYIKRKPEAGFDELRYQTVFSKSYGAVAAPTAGLHFTRDIMNGLRERGTVFAPVTLHVDWDTFMPVREEDYRLHRMHRESYEITEESAIVINRCIEANRRIVCVGTTSVRTIESTADERGFVRPGRGETDLYIYPGYRFKVAEALITNFHMPDSTLILLVSAFAGKKNIEEVYRHAVKNKYRFFSYGDAMFLFNKKG